MPSEMIDIPITGLSGKQDEYRIQPPGLAVLKDGEWEEHGGIQTRKPFSEILDSASNTISDIRRIEPYGDELIAFSKDKLWSYASGDGCWIERAEYLAPKITEKPTLVTTGDQFDADRAEKDNLVFFTWSEETPSGVESYLSVLDAETGAVKLSPTTLDSGALNCRLFETSNGVTLVFYTSDTVHIRVYDTEDLTYSEATQTLTGVNTFDACIAADGSSLYIVAGKSSSYLLIAVSSTPAVTATATAISTVDGGIGIAHDPANSKLAVISNDGSDVKVILFGDDFTLDTAETSVGTAVNVVVNRVAIILEDPGLWRCFWSSGENTGNTSFTVETNTIDDSATVGTESDVIRQCGLASKPFRYNDETFVWVVFSAASASASFVSQLQNTYFLYKSDGTLITKAVSNSAGGFPSSTGYLPSVQEVAPNTFSWCGLYRRIIPLGDGGRGYAAKSLQDVTVEFDSDEARRVARLGDTLYVTGGILHQFDGVNLVETGFHQFPWDLSIIGSSGGTLDGSYNWKQTWHWTNAKGEIEQSTTATIYTQGAIGSNDRLYTILGEPLYCTLKTGSVAEVAARFWRQEGNADLSANFFLVSSRDPAETGNNGYIENDPTVDNLAVFTDNLSDQDLVKQEPDIENGGTVLENLAPSGCSILVATQDRLIFAGIPGNPHTVGYSKLRGAGEIASFNDNLYLDLPPSGGDITAAGFLNETLIIFKETSVYAVSGDGFTNTLQGQNYGPARILSSDVGAISHDTIALTPAGLFFKSAKGFYLVDHGWQVRYIGADVSDFDGDTIRSVHVMESQHQVRVLTDSRLLVWDYIAPGPRGDSGVWAEWSVDDGIDACMYDGAYHYTDGIEVLSQALDWDGNTEELGIDIETGWISFNSLQSYKSVFRIWVLGKHLGAHRLRIRLAYNYKEDWVEDKIYSPPENVGERYQMEHGCARPKCESVKLRITVIADDGRTEEPYLQPTNEALKISGLSAEVQMKRRPYFGLSVSNRQ